jgi:hypothetical protein
MALPAALAGAAKAHPGKRIAPSFQDAARFGQKGRSCRRWWLRGQRPSGPVDQRYSFTYVFAAVEPATGREFCLVLPAVSTAAMNEFLRRFAATLPQDEHAVMVLDGAGWHSGRAPGRPTQCDVAEPAALFSGAEPGGAGLALPARAAPLPPGA